MELKVVDSLHPVHQAQLLTYLKLTDNKLGYLINFHNERVMDGVRWMVKLSFQATEATYREAMVHACPKLHSPFGYFLLEEWPEGRIFLESNAVV